LFKATGLSAAQRLTQADEFVETVVLPLPTLLAMVQRGEVTDAKTLCLLAWACIPALNQAN
jgi:hypothetical protein